MVADLSALVAARVVSVGDRPRAAWAEGLRVHVPRSLLDRPGWRRALASNGDLRVPEGPSRITAEDVTQVREQQAFTDTPPASARLPVNYQIVPGPLRAAIGTIIGRWNRRRSERWGAFPRWPMDLSADVLDDLRDGVRHAGSRRPTPVLLTHDIDSPEGLSNLVSAFLPMEEAAGARSTNYVVPCAWTVDAGLVNELTTRGHHVGVHGYDHSNRTPFAEPAERARRLDAAQRFGERFGAIGYRAPSLLRTRSLLRDLSERFRYDSSMPSAGGLFPVANNGCATARPFLIERIVELPVSLPRDGMLRFLGFKPDEILALWIDCAELVAKSGGVVVLLTHCERRFSGQRPMLDAYVRFLGHVREHPERFMFTTPAQLLAGAA